MKKICWENFEKINFFEWRPFWKWEYLIKGLISTFKIEIFIHLSNLLHSSAKTVEFWGIQWSIGWKYVKSQIFDIFLIFSNEACTNDFFDIFLPQMFSTGQRINTALFRCQILEISNIFIFVIFSNYSWYSYHIYVSFA